MERGWLRARRTALVSTAFTALAIALQIAEGVARALEPAPHPEDPYPLFASTERVLAVVMWMGQLGTGLLGVTIGIAAIADRRGRVLGIASALVALAVILF